MPLQSTKNKPLYVTQAQENGGKPPTSKPNADVVCKFKKNTSLPMAIRECGGNAAQGVIMINITYLKTKAHQANAIDKRAINALKWHILDDLTRKYPTIISKESILDESNYIIVIVDGYENIAFINEDSNCIYEVVQPIDRVNEKLYPMQTLELEVQYKRFYF